jgi:hypothetical protein
LVKYLPGVGTVWWSEEMAHEYAQVLARWSASLIKAKIANAFRGAKGSIWAHTEALYQNTDTSSFRGLL